MSMQGRGQRLFQWTKECEKNHVSREAAGLQGKCDCFGLVGARSSEMGWVEGLKLWSRGLQLCHGRLNTWMRHSDKAGWKWH